MREIEAYYRAENVDEALQLLSRSGVKTTLLAGGTILLAHSGGDACEVVDLQDIGLDQIEVGANQVHIGSMVRIQTLVDHPDIPPLVQQMARLEGPNTMRHAGTVGGLVVDADWESELYAALLVHRTSVNMQTLAGEKIINLDALSSESIFGGIIASISLDSGGEIAHERVARTPADKPIVAVVGRKDQSGDIRVAFCGLSDRPRLFEQDQLENVVPPSDFRGSSAYRRQMAITLSQRVIEQLKKNSHR